MKNKFIELINKFKSDKQNIIVAIIILLSFVSSISYRIYRAKAYSNYATQISYDNSITGFNARNVRDAIENLYAFGNNSSIDVYISANGGKYEDKDSFYLNDKKVKDVIYFTEPTDFPTITATFNTNNQNPDNFNDQTITYSENDSNGNVVLFNGWNDGQGGKLPLNDENLPYDSESNKYKYIVPGYNTSIIASYAANVILPQVTKTVNGEQFECFWTYNVVAYASIKVGETDTIYANNYSNNRTYNLFCNDIKYNVTFDTNDTNVKFEGTDSSTKTVEYAVGSKIDNIPSATNGNMEIEGWYTRQECADNPTTNNCSSARWNFEENELYEDVTLYARWAYKVTFNANSGKFDNSSTKDVYVNHGGALDDITPTRTAYNFNGWYTTKECADNPTTNNCSSARWNFENVENNKVTSNFTLYASWKIINATLNLNGGTLIIDDIQINDGGQVAVDSTTGKLNKPITPTKNGFDFDGWYSDVSLTELFNPDSVLTNDKTLYAKWTQLYTVTFDYNNGTSPITEIVREGEKISNPLSEEEQDFSYGWEYVSETEQLNMWDFNNTIDSDLTLKAKWKQVHKITYYDINGTTILDEKNCVSGESIGLINLEYKEGYTKFEGWMTSSDTVIEYDSNKILTCDSDKSYTAVWSKNVNISFNANGATIDNDSSVSCEVWSNTNTCTNSIKTPSISRMNYDVLGFSTDPNATTALYEHDNNVTISNIYSDTTLYAITKHDVKVDFYANNNTLKLNDQTASGTEVITSGCTLFNTATECSLKTPLIIAPEVTPNVYGYTDGATSYKGDIIANSDSTMNISVNKLDYNKTISLYAQTSSNSQTFTVKYTKTEGIKSISKDKDSCNSGSTFNGQVSRSICELVLPTIEVEDGYNSGKWYDGDKKYNSSEKILVDSERTIEARTSLLSFIVTFNTNGGSTVDNQEVLFNEKATKPEDPVKVGYTFKGWYKDTNYKTEFNFDSAIKADTIVYAKFDKNSKSGTNDRTIKSESGSSISVDKDDEMANKIENYYEEVVTDDEKAIIMQAYFEDADDIYVTDTKVTDSEGNEIEASDIYITYRIPLPPSMTIYDNIKVYSIRDNEKTELSYIIEGGNVVFTTKNTGKFVIAVYPKSEIISSTNLDDSIFINDDLKEKVDKFETKKITGSTKDKIVESLFGDIDTVYIFDAYVYDVTGNKIDTKDDYIMYSIALPEDMMNDDDLLLYKIVGSKKVKINYTIDGGKITFITKGSGRFAVVKESELEDAEPETEKKNSSALPIVIGIIVVLLIAGGVGFFLYSKKKNKME